MQLRSVAFGHNPSGIFRRFCSYLRVTIMSLYSCLKLNVFHVLYYCLEACPLKKSQLDAIDFALNSTFRRSSPHVLKKWLKCVNRYSAARHLPT